MSYTIKARKSPTIYERLRMSEMLCTYRSTCSRSSDKSNLPVFLILRPDRPFAIWLVSTPAHPFATTDIKQLTAGQAPISLARLLDRGGGGLGVWGRIRLAAEFRSAPEPPFDRSVPPASSRRRVPIDGVTARRVFGGELGAPREVKFLCTRKLSQSRPVAVFVRGRRCGKVACV